MHIFCDRYCNRKCNCRCDRFRNATLWRRFSLYEVLPP